MLRFRIWNGRSGLRGLDRPFGMKDIVDMEVGSVLDCKGFDPFLHFLHFPLALSNRCRDFSQMVRIVVLPMQKLPVFRGKAIQLCFGHFSPLSQGLVLGG